MSQKSLETCRMKVFLGRYPRDGGERTIRVRIDKYDIWGMDHSLAHIIVPMLEMLKERKQGVPHVDDEDVPEELRANGQKDKYDSEPFDILEAKWNYVMDAMIWSMQQSRDDYKGEKDTWDVHGEIDREHTFKPSETNPKYSTLNWKVEPVLNKKKFDEYWRKVKYGHTMFGKYFSSLWD